MSDPNKKVIRNPTVEELDSIKKKKVDVGMVVATPHQHEDAVSGEKLVRAQEAFEPDPYLFKLPSGRTTIDKKYLNENNQILIRRMATKEEAMFHDFDKLPFSEAIEPQINSCLKTNIDVSQLSNIDKLAIYLFLIGKSYGEIFDLDIPCTGCGKTSKVKSINIVKDVEIKYVPDDYEYPKKIQLDSYKDKMKLRLIGSFRFPVVEESGILDGTMDIFSQMNALCVEIVDSEGNVLEREERERAITFLDTGDRNKFRKFIQEFDAFGASLIIKNKKVCKNSKCATYYNKIQEFYLPIESVLADIIIRVRDNQ